SVNCQIASWAVPVPRPARTPSITDTTANAHSQDADAITFAVMARALSAAIATRSPRITPTTAYAPAVTWGAHVSNRCAVRTGAASDADPGEYGASPATCRHAAQRTPRRPTRRVHRFGGGKAARA